MQIPLCLLRIVWPKLTFTTINAVMYVAYQSRLLVWLFRQNVISMLGVMHQHTEQTKRSHVRCCSAKKICSWANMCCAHQALMIMSMRHTLANEIISLQLYPNGSIRRQYSRIIPRSASHASGP